MLSENAQKLVDALRSGEYNQGKRALTIVRNDDGTEQDCCLGVVCKLAIEDGVEIIVGNEVGGPLTSGKTLKTYAGATSVLPQVVRKWIGFSTCDGCYDSDNTAADTATTLLADNDGGKTFEEIAAIIESEPRGLFSVAY